MAWKKNILVLALLGMGAPAWADRVILKDGTIREGTVKSQEGGKISLEINNDGFVMVVSINKSDVKSIEKSPPPVPYIAPEQETPPTQPALINSPAATAPDAPVLPAGHAPVSTRPAAPAPAPGNFFGGLWHAAITDYGDPANFPSSQRQLIQDALTAEKNIRPDDELAALVELYNAVPQNIRTRLDAVARKNHSTQPAQYRSFAQWLANARWSVIKTKYNTGAFDLSAVTDYERPELVGILSNVSPGAVNPLLPYFPQKLPPGTKNTGGRPPQANLSGLGVGNAVQVKDQALFTSAVLKGQLKLEPGMLDEDKEFLADQLGNVSRILARVGELEPMIHAAELKAEHDKRVAEQQARHPGQ